ncbi:MAG: zinc-binding dehydrogenase [Thermaurantiacus sp.]
MRAWVVAELGGIDGLRCCEVPEPPAPGPGEATLAMAAVGINFPDLLMLSGDYQFRPELPFTPGMEGVGRIEAVGEGLSSELLGRRVIASARNGLLAERVTLPLAALRDAPETLRDDEAAGFTIGFLTAWVALVQRGHLRAGEHLLVLGAGGGMGLAAVALGQALGAEVTAAAASDAKLAAARAAGATLGLPVAREAPDLTSLHDRVDLVFDPIGGPFVTPALRTLRWGGRYLVIGFVAGPPAAVPLNRLLLKGIEIVGVRAGEQGRRNPAAGREAIAGIDALARAGRLRPHIGASGSFGDARRAFQAMAAGEIIGKAVIRIGEP